MVTLSTSPRIFVATPLMPQEGDPGWPKKEAIDLVEPIPSLVLSAWRLAAFDANVRFAEKVCREIALVGGAPLAPHLLFPRFLDDNVPAERGIGMRCGKAYLVTCDEAWFVLPEWRSELSSGMVAEREAAGGLLRGDAGIYGPIHGFDALRDQLRMRPWFVGGVS